MNEPLSKVLGRVIRNAEAGQPSIDETLVSSVSGAPAPALIELAQLFRLLGDPSRLSIVVACLHEPVCVSDLAERTDLSQSLVSHHLRLLRGARVLRGERRGKQIFYVAADEHVRRMIGDMVEHVTECDADVRLP